MSSRPENLTPLGSWLLCKGLKPKERTKSGLWVPTDWDKNVRSEGVAEVVRVGPGKVLDDGTIVPHGIQPGDRIIYRGFLRYAWQFGDLLESEKSSDFFMIDAFDVLAIVEGSGGTIGYLGEYVL